MKLGEIKFKLESIFNFSRSTSLFNEIEKVLIKMLIYKLDSYSDLLAKLLYSSHEKYALLYKEIE